MGYLKFDALTVSLAEIRPYVYIIIKLYQINNGFIYNR